MRTRSLIASLPMLPTPGSSRPASRSALARRSVIRPISVSVCTFISCWRIDRVVDLAVGLGQRDEQPLGAGDHRPAATAAGPAARLDEVAGPLGQVPGDRAGVGQGDVPAGPPALSPARSNISVVLATAQPLFRPPTIHESGTRASDMNTSLNSARPVISRSGRTSTALPWCMSKANQVMPWCLGASGLVRAMSMPMSAICPPEVHTFWPLITHSSPSRTALQPRPARSEPAPGLAEQLAPRPLPGDDRPDELLDLLRRAVRGDGRRGEQHAQTGRRAEHATLAEAGRTRPASRRATGPCRRPSPAATAPPSRTGRGAPTTRRPSGRDPSWRRSRRRVRRAGSHC